MTDIGFLSEINITRKLDGEPLLLQIKKWQQRPQLETKKLEVVGKIGANFSALIPLIDSASHHTFSETTWSEHTVA